MASLPEWSTEESLGPGRSVPDLLRFAHRIHRFLDRQEDGRFERAQRTATTYRHRHRCHGHIVGRLPEVVPIVRPEGMPEPVKLPADASVGSRPKALGNNAWTGRD